MFRNLGWAALTAIALGVPAAAPCHAADLGGSYPGGSYGQYRSPCPRFCNGVPVSFGYGLCYRQELLQTPWGPRWRLVNRCY